MSGIQLVWENPDLNMGLYYEIRYKKAGDADSKYKTVLIPFGYTTHHLYGVKDGQTYHIEMRTVGYFSNSEWLDNIPDHIVVGKTAKPLSFGFNDLFTIFTDSDGTRFFEFSQANPEADVRVGGGYKIRYYFGSTTNWAVMTDLHRGLLKTSPYETNQLAVGYYTFAIKPVDSSGNESENAFFINTSLGNPRTSGGAVYSQVQQPLWAGTKTNCQIVDGKLVGTSTLDWSSIAIQWDSLPTSWFEVAGGATNIEYTTPVISLGVDVSFNARLNYSSSGTTTVQFKTGTLVDGTVVGSWQTYTAQRFTNIAFIQFKFTVDNGSSIAYLNTCEINLEGDVKINYYDDVNIGGQANTTWFTDSGLGTGEFKIAVKDGNITKITQAKITAVQGTGVPSGFTNFNWIVMDKTDNIGGTPAAKFKTFDGATAKALPSGVLVDIELRGVK
jgi:hypothetical protein